MLTRSPVVGHDPPDAPALDGVPQPPSGLCAAVARGAADEPLPMPVNSNPYPAEVFFEPMPSMQLIHLHNLKPGFGADALHRLAAPP